MQHVYIFNWILFVKENKYKHYYIKKHAIDAMYVRFVAIDDFQTLPLIKKRL